MASTWGALTWSSNSWGSINNTVSVTGLECNTGLLGENLVVNSVDLDSSFPNQFRATVQSNAGSSPFGTNDATLLKGNGSDTGTKVLFKFGFNTPSPGDIQTFSIFAKDSSGGTGGTFQLEVGNSAQRALVQFNITNGARTGFSQSSEVSFVEGDSVNFGNGWYRFRLTVQYESGFNKPNTNVGMQLNGSAADDPGVFLFGAQVEEQTTLTSYKPTYGTAVSSNLSTQIDVAPVATGLALTSSLGNENIEISFEITPTGSSLTSSLGTADAGPDAMVTGLNTASLSLGTLDAFNVEGWGRRTWNSFAWGIGGTLESTGLGTNIGLLGQNFYQFSQDFSQGYWQKNSTAINTTPTDATAPDGTNTAQGIQEDSATSGHNVIRNSLTTEIGKQYTISVFAKFTGQRYLQINTGAGDVSSNPHQNFDIENGVLGSKGGTITGSITDVGNGWYRCAVVVTSAVTTGFIPVYGLVPTTTSGRAPSYTGQGTGAGDMLLLWGAQFEEGDSVTGYYPTFGQPLLSSLSITGDANVTPTGLALTSSLGNEDVEISFEIELTGQALTSNLGIADAGPDAMATGNQATMATGTVEAYNQEGWGRYFWGLFEYGATGEWEFVTATSLPLTANLGNETVTGDANVSVTGIALTSNLGTADPSPDATVTGIGFSASLAVGSVITGTADVTVTGIGMPMGLGTGQLDAVSLIDVTGISMSVTLNSVTTKGFANVSVTGFALTSTLNNANTLIWNEIDTGSAPVWTEVPTRAA